MSEDPFNLRKRKIEYDIPLNSIITPSIHHDMIDALIYDHPCFHYNTHYIGIDLIDNKKRMCDSDNDLTNYLIGLRYSIIIGDVCIYQGILTKGNLFPVNNVPLSFVAHTEISLCIHNINVNPDNYLLRIIHYESSLNHSSPCRIVWSPLTDSKNYLLLNTDIDEPTDVMNKYPMDYVKKYGISYKILGLKHININNFYDNYYSSHKVNTCAEVFCTPYSNERAISLLFDKSYSCYDMVSETFITPTSIVDGVYVKFITCTCDALSNMEIITKKDVTDITYNISSNRDGYSKNFRVAYTKIKNGYRLMCCNDHMHLITIGDITVTLNITVDTSKGFMSSIVNWGRKKKKRVGNKVKTNSPNMDTDSNTNTSTGTDASIDVDIDTDDDTNDEIDDENSEMSSTESNHTIPYSNNHNTYSTSDVLLKYDRYTYGVPLRNKWINIIKNYMPNNLISCVTDAPSV